MGKTATNKSTHNGGEEKQEKEKQQKLKKLENQQSTLENKIKSINLLKPPKGRSLSTKEEKQNARAAKELDKLKCKLKDVRYQIRELQSGSGEVVKLILSKVMYCISLHPCLQKLWVEAKDFWTNNLLVETDLPFYKVPIGLNIEERITGNKVLTMTHVAALTHDVDWLKEILEEDDGKIESFVQPTVGSLDTPLHLACLMSNNEYDPIGYAKTVEFLVAKIKRVPELTKPNYSKQTPLILASRSGNFKACMALCKKMNADGINYMNANGQTAFINSVKAGNVKICKLLLDKGGVIDTLCYDDDREGGGGQNALHILTRAAARGQVNFEGFQDIFQLLVENGLDPAAQSIEYQQTVLHIAAYEQNIDPIGLFLLENYVPTDACDVFGKLPLDYVSRLDKGMLRDMFLFHASYSEVKHKKA